jgi:hypothetical protein
MWDSLMTALLPRLTNRENPMFSLRAQSRMATHRAPDWEKNAILPSPGCPAAKEALTWLGVLIIPRQLGPMSAMPCSRHSSASLFSR